MLEVEATGKTIEQAIENALFELKVPRDDVDIKILDQGGFFKKAKVLVKISKDAEEKHNKHKEMKEELEDLSIEDIKASIKQDINVEVQTKENKKDENKKEEKKVKISTDEEISSKENEVKISKKQETVVDPEEFLKGLLKVCNIDAQVEQKIVDGVKLININGENINPLIGYRGDALYAISYLTSQLAGRENKVRVDIGGYRAKREETLKELAFRMAKKVEKTGFSVKLEPMEPSERRIIHLALQESDTVETTSKGNEPHRFVIINPKKA